jgi:AcrR family transcriptional regulator
MASVATSLPVRSTYRHGDLRRALLDAGIALARDGGPDAVVLREATRRAGVVPNAAYRHFGSRSDLLQAVRAAALSALAVAMEAELARSRRVKRHAERAHAGLRAIGIAYLRFARSEPGLFRTAFAAPRDPDAPVDPAMAGRSGLNPFQLLGAALDRMVEAGVLPQERRPGAEYLAWSAVHGLAMLVLDGPLHRLTHRQARDIGRRLLDMVEKGLGAVGSAMARRRASKPCRDGISRAPSSRLSFAHAKALQGGPWSGDNIGRSPARAGLAYQSCRTAGQPPSHNREWQRLRCGRNVRALPRNAVDMLDVRQASHSAGLGGSGMARSSIYRPDGPSVVKVTLGSVVASGDQYGVVWHATPDMLRVLLIRREMTSLPLSMANEVALHLPVSPAGWGIVCDELIAWPRALCHLVGELDERCLLKILEARKTVSRSPSAAVLAPALADKVMSATTRHSARFF